MGLKLLSNALLEKQGLAFQPPKMFNVDITSLSIEQLQQKIATNINIG